MALEIKGEMKLEYTKILTPDAMHFLGILLRTFTRRRTDLLLRRISRQVEIDYGTLPNFLLETAPVRAGDWQCARVPSDLHDRRVEITGPVERKTIINALNSGANVFMADFEDSLSPTWDNVVRGQINLYDAVRCTISFTNPEGKEYRLADKTAVLMVRPRGWHLPEKHLLYDGVPIPASLFDFALFMFHNASELLARGTGPYFYLPKLESHLEARLWADIFAATEDWLALPHGTIRTTVLIETILAAFEMDEVLYELRDYALGLNCGRWDYIFSFIKKFRRDPLRVTPDRALITMDKGFLRAYVDMLIDTCHRRGVHAMGGMAAQIPIKNDPEANARALEKVRADKLREVQAGHDGTWVAHPGLIPVARAIFDEHMSGPNQLHVRKTPRLYAELVNPPTGEITEIGLRTNINVAIQYLESWLSGNGCVPINNLMEDAATAEISRAQVWQWIHHQVTLKDGRAVTADLVRSLLYEEARKIRYAVDEARSIGGKYEQAMSLFYKLVTAAEFPEFLTLSAYEFLP